MARRFRNRKNLPFRAKGSVTDPLVGRFTITGVSQITYDVAGPFSGNGTCSFGLVGASAVGDVIWEADIPAVITPAGIAILDTSPHPADEMYVAWLKASPALRSTSNQAIGGFSNFG